MALNLEKKQELVRLCLEKRKVPTDIRLSVKLVLDVSGSIKWLFDNGTIQELVDRLIPVAMRFDDNQSIEAYAFGTNVAKVNDIQVSDFGSYVNRKFLSEVPSRTLWSGTKYSVALDKVLGDSAIAKVRLFGSLFGKKKAEQPGYVMFVTDGETQGDEYETEELLRRYQAANVYVQLIGIGNANFSFLERMADKFSNVGFVTFPRLEVTDDEAMYSELLGQELCEWVKAR